MSVVKKNVGKNVNMTVNGTKLVIEIDLSKDFGPSKSGKSNTVATTNGNVEVPGFPTKLGINAYNPV